MSVFVSYSTSNIKQQILTCPMLTNAPSSITILKLLLIGPQPSPLANKGTQQINLRQIKVRESHQDKTTCILHIPGVINGSDIFTKEMKEDAHFRCLRDSIMVSKAAFLQYGHTAPTHIMGKSLLPYYTIRSPVPHMTHDVTNSRDKIVCHDGVKAWSWWCWYVSRSRLSLTSFPSVLITGGCWGE